MLQMLNTEYAKVHKDYKGVINGQKTVMRLVYGATCLVPVNVIKEKDLDAIITAAYNKVANCVQVPMMQLPKIYAIGRAAYMADGNVADVEKAIDNYIVNNGWKVAA